MTFTITEFTAGGIVSFIILLIGIAIKATLKVSEVSQSLKLTNNEIVTLREQAKANNKPTDNRTNDSIPHEHMPNAPSPMPLGVELNDKQKNILIFLALNRDSHVGTISSQLKTAETAILHDLEVLKATGLSTYYWRNKTWNISTDGRLYVNANKLLT
jgi:hypothetical protein